MARINRRGKIVKATLDGDTVVAEFTPGVNNDQIQVAQDELTKFLSGCIERHGRIPPVYAKRCGEVDYSPFRIEGFPVKAGSKVQGTDRMLDVETILIQEPHVGG